MLACFYSISLFLFNKGSTNLLIAVLVDLHAQSVSERGIEAEKEREKENVKGRLLHLLLLATVHKVTKDFVLLSMYHPSAI